MLPQYTNRFTKNLAKAFPSAPAKPEKKVSKGKTPKAKDTPPAAASV